MLGSLVCLCYLLAPIVGNKEGGMGLMALRVRPKPTRIPANILDVPVNSTILHSIPIV